MQHQRDLQSLSTEKILHNLRPQLRLILVALCISMLLILVMDNALVYGEPLVGSSGGNGKYEYTTIAARFYCIVWCVIVATSLSWALCYSCCSNCRLRECLVNRIWIHSAIWVLVNRVGRRARAKMKTNFWCKSSNDKQNIESIIVDFLVDILLTTGNI